jgi:hypothetical protein
VSLPEGLFGCPADVFIRMDLSACKAGGGERERERRPENRGGKGRGVRSLGFHRIGFPVEGKSVFSLLGRLTVGYECGAFTLNRELMHKKYL